MGSIWQSSHFICDWLPNIASWKTGNLCAFFELSIIENLYPLYLVGNPMGSTCQSFHSICDWWKKNWISKPRCTSAFLEISKTFIHCREVRTHCRWGPLGGLSILYDIDIGVQLTVFPFYMPMLNVNWAFKKTFINRLFSKCWKPLLFGCVCVCGCVGGLAAGWAGGCMGWCVVIKRAFNFLKLKKITSTICWFQICPPQLSPLIRSKVMSNLISKFSKFMADLRREKLVKTMIVIKDFSREGKLRKVSGEKKLSNKFDRRFKKNEKTEKPKTTPKSSQ